MDRAVAIMRRDSSMDGCAPRRSESSPPPPPLSPSPAPRLLPSPELLLLLAAREWASPCIDDDVLWTRALARWVAARVASVRQTGGLGWVRDGTEVVGRWLTVSQFIMSLLWGTLKCGVLIAGSLCSP